MSDEKAAEMDRKISSRNMIRDRHWKIRDIKIWSYSLLLRRVTWIHRWSWFFEAISTKLNIGNKKLFLRDKNVDIKELNALNKEISTGIRKNVKLYRDQNHAEHSKHLKPNVLKRKLTKGKKLIINLQYKNGNRKKTL